KKFDQKVSFQAVGGHYSVNVTTGGGGRSCQFTSTEFRQISPNQVEFFAVGQDYFDLVPEDKVVCQVTLTFTNSNTVSVSSTLEECRSFCSLNRDAVLEIASAQRLSK